MKAETNDHNDPMTTTEAATLLQVDTKTIRNLIKAGRLSARKPAKRNSSYLIPLDDVLAEQKRRQSIKRRTAG